MAPEEIAQKVAWVREAAGERFAQLELGYTVFQVLPTDGKAQGTLPHSIHVLAGSLEEIVDEIIARREQYGFSYVQVLEQQIESFAHTDCLIGRYMNRGICQWLREMF